MASPHDIEGRVENRLADCHSIKPALTVGRTTFNTSTGRIDMRLASYHMRGRPSFGAVVGDGIVDLRARLSRFPPLLEVFRAQALDQARPASAGVRPDVPLAEVELLPPLLAPEKILCIGIHYQHRERD